MWIKLERGKRDKRSNIKRRNKINFESGNRKRYIIFKTIKKDVI